ncbi:hypothetical protein GCE86_19645 [Micromonospora terminaliae]|uniref:Uncharacterized protein n=1 Tax=Micromonospora terminaliae TaxID=1914461 RepID=A0AAJ3DJH8_9ACTN|nr:hypothetical protein [Micromonospora terminaliae]NES28954.1 hypothetical protein [Micromonospora terminaliae]QGL49027.1 hypothetical protein GCE86_19645 [Micromonospora terminaliae]
MTSTTNAAPSCCGVRLPGAAGALLVNACQLCPSSPTYWRNRPPSPAPTGQATPTATALPERTGGLVWSGHATGDPMPCRLCGRPALMRDAEGRPCHKVCAEQATQTPEADR